MGPPTPKQRDSPHGQAEVFGWIGWQQRDVMTALQGLGWKSFARPLHYDDQAAQLSLLDLVDQPVDRALDPCTYLRQFPRSWRPACFRRTPYGDGPKFVASLRSMAPRDRQEYSESIVEAQRNRGASAIFPPYHLVGGPASTGRLLDVDLCRRSLDHYINEALDEPPKHSLVRQRRFLAAVGVQRGALTIADIDRLADLYASLEVDGFWVRAEDFSDNGPIDWIQRVSALVGALRESGRPVVVAQPGRLRDSLLANDVSCAVGLVGYERFDVPKAERGEGGGQRFAFHEHSAKTYKPSADRAKHAFRDAGCRCGAHPALSPPTGRALVAHSAILGNVMIREALTGTVAARRARALESLETAREFINARDLGDSTSPRKARAVFDGLDSDRLRRRA